MAKNKLFTLLKASMYGNMNIFKVGRKNKNSVSGKLSKTVILTLCTLLIMSVFAMYAVVIITPLKEFKMAHIAITLFGIVTTVMIFIQGIYRSQGIFFDAKDNDMLFSMPIKKSTIFSVRLIKLIAFQYMWDFIIMFPLFATYAVMIKPNYTFYVTSVIMLITLPIIPTVISSIVGYVIQSVSSRFKMKKLVQTLGTIIFSLVIIYFSFNTNNFLENIASKAQNINDMITKIYYPMGIYNECFTNFNAIKLIALVGANILLTVIFILIFSLSYYKVISRLSEKHSVTNYKFKKMKSNSALWALTKKELKKYFGTPIYVFNTIIGPAMLILVSVYALISKEKLLGDVATYLGGLDISNYVGKALIVFMMFTMGVATTTASSVSIEGKTFWLTKSLPVSEKKIFLSKIIVNLIIAIPATVISTFVVIYVFKISFIDSIYCMIAAIIIPLMVATLGLLINLKYPKMNSISDAAVVKQSASTMITMFSTFALIAIPFIILAVFKIQNINLFTGVILGIFICFSIVLWKILTSYGIKLYRKIN